MKGSGAGAPSCSKTPTHATTPFHNLQRHTLQVHTYIYIYPANPPPSTTPPPSPFHPSVLPSFLPLGSFFQVRSHTTHPSHPSIHPSIHPYFKRVPPLYILRDRPHTPTRRKTRRMESFRMVGIFLVQGERVHPASRVVCVSYVGMDGWMGMGWCIPLRATTDTHTTPSPCPPPLPPYPK